MCPHKTVTLGKWLSSELWFLPCKMEVRSPVVDVVRQARSPTSEQWLF